MKIKANASRDSAIKTVLILTWLDLVFCAAFGIPFVSDASLSLLNSASMQMNLPSVIVETSSARFFVNLAGFFGVLWNVAMLRSFDPNLHKIDLIARAWLIGLVVFHIIMSGLSPIFSVFILTEIIGGVFKIKWLRTINPS